jgi:uncharacterized RDD family membrane protein YckC
MTKPHYAGFWIRLLADGIDTLLIWLADFLLLLMGLGLIYWTKVALGTASGEESFNVLGVLSSEWLQASLWILRGGLALLYFTWATYKYGTTLGKRVFRISVVSAQDLGPVSFWNSLVRCLSYALSYLPLCAGFLMAGLHPEKKALHDLIAGTVSIVKKRDLKVEVQ